MKAVFVKEALDLCLCAPPRSEFKANAKRHTLMMGMNAELGNLLITLANGDEVGTNIAASQLLMERPEGVESPVEE